ncbi:MAG TPA: energy-coupling factor transporter transmembrane component T [Candidatus Dormibacteraeota bacterium]|nr:energy-coupling factor transporter transmembrane component T [Candidatus Dormibacteraeota bacterium]
MIRHPLAWCAWSLAAIAIAFIDRNPFMQGLLLLVIVNTWLPYRRGRALYLRLGIALAVFPIVFSLALSRFGDHVIVVLPPIPIVGGPWTWEALVFGISSGLALLLTVAVFGVLQSSVRSADLLSLLPRPLYRAGTAFALSLALAPKTIASFQSIREARQLRGQRTGWRAAPLLVVPLLLTTLEQALQYGESLDARGYGSRQRSRYRPLGWSTADLLVTAAALTALGLTIGSGPPPYNPYTHLMPPLPSSLSILAVLLLALPAAITAIPHVDHAAHHL